MGWRSAPGLLLVSSCLLLVLVQGATDFRICAYNVQQFNSTKAANSRVMHTLTRVASHCDIILIQEVMDPAVIVSLLKSLNREVDRYDDYSYKSVSSESLGNKPTNMQRYVFIYRTDTVNVTGQHQYRKKDSFVREPFNVRFQSNRTAIKSFILVALHAEPRQAVQEMDRLYDVFLEVSKKWNSKDVMFLGDFHAGCSYMSRHDKKRIRIFKSAFSWLISDRVDTTASEDTHCPYDRIVVHGKAFLKGIKPLSAKVFDFGKQFKLTRDKILRMSDHLPVEVTLKSSAPLLQATPLLLLLLFLTIVPSPLSPL